MPSIAELFGPSPESDFDLEAFLKDGEGLAASSAAKQYAQAGIEPFATTDLPGAGEPEGPAGSPGEPPADPSDPAPGGAPEPEGEPAPAPAPPADPLDAIPPERRAFLLSLDEAMTRDEAFRGRVMAATAPPEAPPAAPAPTLPPHIDPESFEGQLWAQQQQVLARLDSMSAEATETRRQADLAKNAAQAAHEAGNRFAARYEGRLTKQDVEAIATEAGTSGLAGRLANGAPDLTQAFDQALEHVLWTSDSWRQKVVGVPAPSGPTPEQQATAEATNRKRQLNALATGASPVAAPADRTPLEYRSDGRLTNDSRLRVVAEAAGALRQNRESF